MIYAGYKKNNKKVARKVCWCRQRVYICYTNNNKQMKKRTNKKIATSLAVQFVKQEAKKAAAGEAATPVRMNILKVVPIVAK